CQVEPYLVALQVLLVHRFSLRREPVATIARFGLALGRADPAVFWRATSIEPLRCLACGPTLYGSITVSTHGAARSVAVDTCRSNLRSARQVGFGRERT